MNKCDLFHKSLIATALLASSSTLAYAGAKHKNPGFERIATYEVCQNTSCDTDVVEETSAEIIASSEDGKTLVYTDSPLGVIGFLDIRDAERPKGLGTVDVGGEPTSVAVKGDYALVGVNTSESFVTPSGFLAVYDIKECEENSLCQPLAKLDMGGQPDSIAVSPNGKYAAIVIENERDEDIEVNGEEGGLPQLPAGFLNVVKMKGDPSSWIVEKVDLTGLADVAPSDPEPEYVDINRFNQAVVTMQENNHLVVVDLKSATVIADYPAGSVTLEGVDTTEEDVIALDGTVVDVPREADAVSWIDNARYVTANEGDLFGGSRGFTVYDREGNVLYDSGVEFEYLAVRSGHYPESRSENKGSEPEGVEVGKFGKKKYIFVGSERGSFVAVYQDRGSDRAPRFIQLLPTGIGPEGLLAIPKKNLFVVAAEVDEGYRSQISLFRLRENQTEKFYPTIYSTNNDEGKPIGWGALSGLTASVDDVNTLYAVHDSYYNDSRIYKIHVEKGRQKRAVITNEIVIMKDGDNVSYDLEGIAQKADGGFWLVSEGSGTVGDEDRPVESANLLIEVDSNGTVLQEVTLPDSLNAIQLRFGLEGVALTGTGDDAVVYVAFQREWQDDATGMVKIGRYQVNSGEWSFINYELGEKSPAGGWVGLSDLTATSDNEFVVIERDNQLGTNAAVKRIYRFSTLGKRFESHGEVLDVISKQEQVLVRDVLPVLKDKRGYVLDKLEGLAITAEGRIYVVTDNDGVDDSSGETQFINLGDYGENNL